MVSQERITSRQLSLAEACMASLDWDSVEATNNNLADFISNIYKSPIAIRVQHTHDAISGIIKNSPPIAFVAEDATIKRSQNGRTITYEAIGYIAFVRRTFREPFSYSVDVITNYGLGQLVKLLLPIKGHLQPLISTSSEEIRLNRQLGAWEDNFPKLPEVS